MLQYLYLLAWVSGSDSACGEDTKIHNQNDLMREYLAGNEHVFAVQINFGASALQECNAEDIANAYGCMEAFYNNYTAHDSTSTCVMLPPNFKHPSPVKEIFL